MDRSKPKSKLLVALTLLASLAASGAKAQKPECVSLDFSSQDALARQCGLDFKGLEAAAASILRQNGYVISSQNERCLQVWLDTASLDLQDNHCAMTLELGFSFFPISFGVSPMQAPWGASYWPRAIICRQVVLADGPKPMQTQVRDSLIQATEKCLLEEERNRIRPSR
jgi:hypothetical protein